MMQIRIMRSAGVMAGIHVSTPTLLSSLADARAGESTKIRWFRFVEGGRS
jgi:hypothetical protein